LYSFSGLVAVLSHSIFPPCPATPYNKLCCAVPPLFTLSFDRFLVPPPSCFLPFFLATFLLDSSSSPPPPMRDVPYVAYPFVSVPELRILCSYCSEAFHPLHSVRVNCFFSRFLHGSPLVISSSHNPQPSSFLDRWTYCA